ncbi:hypothetical protein DFS33DRAFT_1315171 [Desarmillaria ectypa]|nr:hypothetical protein DFS33DRAFT_1315171 [Desarmillaria ectypa]
MAPSSDVASRLNLLTFCLCISSLPIASDCRRPRQADGRLQLSWQLATPQPKTILLAPTSNLLRSSRLRFLHRTCQI